MIPVTTDGGFAKGWPHNCQFSPRKSEDFLLTVIKGTVFRGGQCGCCKVAVNVNSSKWSIHIDYGSAMGLELPSTNE